MVRTQIYLTEREREELSALAKARRRPQSELVREALDGYLAAAQRDRRRESIAAAAGMWADRADLPDFAESRRSWDRELER